jgi:hypothetical protein
LGGHGRLLGLVDLDVAAARLCSTILLFWEVALVVVVQAGVGRGVAAAGAFALALGDGKDTRRLANRYVPELTCQQRERYRIEPLCDEASVLRAVDKP